MIHKTFSIKFQGKRYIIKDYKICSGFFSKMRGLMFRSWNYRKPLLFVWEKPIRQPIHSFFCRDFLGIWMIFDGSKSRVIDERIVKPFKYSVIPKKKFNLLLEVPIKYFEFADGKGKV